MASSVIILLHNSKRYCSFPPRKDKSYKYDILRSLNIIQIMKLNYRNWIEMLQISDISYVLHVFYVLLRHQPSINDALFIYYPFYYYIPYYNNQNNNLLLTTYY